MTGAGGQDEGDAREETFAALSALASLADRSETEGWAKLAAALRKTVEVVEARLRSSELTIVVAGGRAKRTLYNVLAGAVLFDPHAEDAPATFLTLRRAPGMRFGYVARTQDGRVEELSGRHPDRSAWFEREIAKAKKELEAARLRITTIDVELTAKEETLSERQLRAAETTRAHAGASERLRAFYALFLAWLLAVLRRPPPPLPPPSTRRRPADGRVVSAMIARRDIERAMEDAQAALAKREKEVERIQEEAARHVEERNAAFVGEVRVLTDRAKRGADVVELTLDLPGGLLPEDVVIIDAPATTHRREIRDRAGACLLLAGSPTAGEIEDAVRPIVPYVVDASDQRLRDLLPALFERLRAEAPLSVLALALADMPMRMEALARAASVGETEQRARIETLERNRLPEPGQFREEQLAQMTGAFDEGARRVLKRARTRLGERARELEREWISLTEACNDRASLGVALARIDESTTERFQELLDGVGDDIGAEMHATSEFLQVWMLEEVRQRYKTHYLHPDKTAPVVAELPSDEIAALRHVPLSRLLNAHGRRRAAIALGTIATGASIGGAIHAAMGAAIGAGAGLVAGLAASFLPRVDAVRDRCVAAIRARVASVETAIAAWLEASYGNFARDIRSAVDDALASALERRDQSIVRLIELEAKTLESERQKLRDLETLKNDLARHATELSRLATSAAETVRAHVAATRGSTASFP